MEWWMCPEKYHIIFKYKALLFWVWIIVNDYTPQVKSVDGAEAKPPPLRGHGIKQAPLETEPSEAWRELSRNPSSQGF